MNDAQRASLIEEHRGLVFRAVRLIWPRVRDHVDQADLIAMGDLGLVEAAARFDPEAGAAFSTFAWYRVQGAILDGLRRAGNLPRRVWTQLMALRAAGEVLEARARKEAAARTRGAPSPSTEAQLAEVKEAVAQIHACYAICLQVTVREDQHPVDPALPPDQVLDRERARKRVTEALASLPEKERLLVEKHYLEGKTLTAAGEELGLSRSWASRLHAQAVERLQKRLGDTS